MDSVNYGIAVALLMVGIILLNVPLIAAGIGWFVGATFHAMM